jgi:DNA-binding transcriptional MerR regulator
MEIDPSSEESMNQADFPTPIASKLTGVSVKTLENWDTRGFLKPSIMAARGHGASRVYSFRDLIAIRIADDLRGRGIDVRNLRRVVDYLRRRKGLELTTSDVLASTVLVSDGHDVYEVDLERGVHTSTLLRPNQSTLLVPLGHFVAKIKADALKGLASTSGGSKPRRVRTA